MIPGTVAGVRPSPRSVATARRQSPFQMPVPTDVPSPTSPEEDVIPRPQRSIHTSSSRQEEPEVIPRFHRRVPPAQLRREAPSSPTELPVPTAVPSPTSPDEIEVAIPVATESRRANAREAERARLERERAAAFTRPHAQSPLSEMPVPTAVPSPSSVEMDVVQPARRRAPQSVRTPTPADMLSPSMPVPLPTPTMIGSEWEASPMVPPPQAQRSRHSPSAHDEVSWMPPANIHTPTPSPATYLPPARMTSPPRQSTVPPGPPSSPTELPVPTAVPSPTSSAVFEEDDRRDKHPGTSVARTIFTPSVPPVAAHAKGELTELPSPTSPASEGAPRVGRRPRRRESLHPPSSPTELPVPTAVPSPTSSAFAEIEQVRTEKFPGRRVDSALYTPTTLIPAQWPAPTSPTHLPVPTEVPSPTSPDELSRRQAQTAARERGMKRGRQRHKEERQVRSRRAERQQILSPDDLPVPTEVPSPTSVAPDDELSQMRPPGAKVVDTVLSSPTELPPQYSPTSPASPMSEDGGRAPSDSRTIATTVPTEGAIGTDTAAFLDTQHTPDVSTPTATPIWPSPARQSRQSRPQALPKPPSKAKAASRTHTRPWSAEERAAVERELEYQQGSSPMLGLEPPREYPSASPGMVEPRLYPSASPGMVEVGTPRDRFLGPDYPSPAPMEYPSAPMDYQSPATLDTGRSPAPEQRTSARARRFRGASPRSGAIPGHASVPTFPGDMTPTEATLLPPTPTELPVSPLISEGQDSRRSWTVADVRLESTPRGRSKTHSVVRRHGPTPTYSPTEDAQPQTPADSAVVMALRRASGQGSSSYIGEGDVPSFTPSHTVEENEPPTPTLEADSAAYGEESSVAGSAIGSGATHVSHAGTPVSAIRTPLAGMSIAVTPPPGRLTPGSPMSAASRTPGTPGSGAGGTPQPMSQPRSPGSFGPMTPLSFGPQPSTPALVRLPGLESPTPTYEPDDETVCGDDAESVASFMAACKATGTPLSGIAGSAAGTPVAGTPVAGTPIMGTLEATASALFVPAGTPTSIPGTPQGFSLLSFPGTPQSLRSGMPGTPAAGTPIVHPGTPDVRVLPRIPSTLSVPSGSLPPPAPLPAQAVRDSTSAALYDPFSSGITQTAVPGSSVAPSAIAGAAPRDEASMPPLASEVFGDRGRRTHRGTASSDEELPPWKRRQRRRK